MKLSGVGMYYAGRVILRDISLEIQPGTVTLLTGANGAGKSTLLRIMAGLTRPSLGTVTWDKDCNARCNEDHGRTIGYLGHVTFMYPGLSAIENLAFWNRLYGRDTRTATLMDALERVGLSRYAEEQAGAFSRGMAQRLNLARVLLLEPDLLLLDEPSSGLDTKSLLALRREITLARDRGAAIIWISHDVQTDSASADRLLMLRGHRLFYDGPPADCPGIAGDPENKPERQ